MASTTSSSSPSSSSSSYVCDTIPAARLATATATPGSTSWENQDHNNTVRTAFGDPNSDKINTHIIDVDVAMVFEPTPPVVPDELPPGGLTGQQREGDEMVLQLEERQLQPQEQRSRSLTPPAFEPQPPPRKLCVRHQRMADEGTNLKLQQSLDELPLEEREQVNAIWQAFSSSSHPRRALILQGLLTMCCFSQLSLLTEHLTYLIRIDPFLVLPREVSLKILKYLDATSLCRAAQVSTRWRALADDDILWRGICEQHIGQKCMKCGWGLPVLEKKRGGGAGAGGGGLGGASPDTLLMVPSPVLSPLPSMASSPAPPTSRLLMKRGVSEEMRGPPLKRQKSEDGACSPANALIPPSGSGDVRLLSVTRPWKDVYSERMTVERNWRRGRCTVRTLKGHTDGVMCLQFSETLRHPAFPVLITGSYDCTVRVWNMETGVELRCLKGHTRAVRALQFDEVKLITGSMDNTIRVWDWRKGTCIRTLTGHAGGVVSLNFDSNVLASGSVDATIKVWNLRSGGAFTLKGHSDWVNAVQLWDSRGTNLEPSTYSETRAQCGLQIDPGKMLFSASDDGTVRLWDLAQRTCIRQFMGHVGQVQSMKLLVDDCSSDDEDEEDREDKTIETYPSGGNWSSGVDTSSSQVCPASEGKAKRKKPPVLISGSLDNTIKMWDIETGKTVRTFFGHIEGVWAVASDRLRLVSGSQDRTIKVWSREEGKCTATLFNHEAAVSCLALGEDKIVSGSDDNDIKIWSFSS